MVVLLHDVWPNVVCVHVRACMHACVHVCAWRMSLGGTDLLEREKNGGTLSQDISKSS